MPVFTNQKKSRTAFQHGEKNIKTKVNHMCDCVFFFVWHGVLGGLSFLSRFGSGNTATILHVGMGASQRLSAFSLPL